MMTTLPTPMSRGNHLVKANEKKMIESFPNIQVQVQFRPVRVRPCVRGRQGPHLAAAEAEAGLEADRQPVPRPRVAGERHHGGQDQQD